jgi:hypothetical protein
MSTASLFILDIVVSVDVPCMGSYPIFSSQYNDSQLSCVFKKKKELEGYGLKINLPILFYLLFLWIRTLFILPYKNK